MYCCSNERSLEIIFLDLLDDFSMYFPSLTACCISALEQKFKLLKSKILNIHGKLFAVNFEEKEKKFLHGKKILALFWEISKIALIYQNKIQI